jgi:phospholipid/cholesterol/gamma-HCH transport system substrate-binding protein
VVALAVAGAMTLGGCSLSHGLYDVSLPGGADLGGHPYSVTVYFANALDLVPQSGVKVNDVAVGKVDSISIADQGRLAKVRVSVNGDVRLPANATASIQQTTLLGEKYVALAAPGTPRGTLRDGATIRHGSNGVEVEQVLGALSTLLNGGGVAQLRDVSQALNEFAGGHETQLRTFLTSLRTVVAQMNSRRSDITTALDALATLSGTLRKSNTTIARVLTSLSPGIKVLADQHDQVITALTKLRQLSTITVDTLDRSKANIVGDLRALAPILTQLASAGSALPKSLQVLATYPFSDSAVGAIRGDYINGYVTTAFNTPGGRVRPSSSGPPVLLPATASAVPGSGSTVALAAPSKSAPSKAGR